MTGSRNRVSTHYQGCCETCSLKIIAKANTTPATETMNMPRTATKKNSKKTAPVVTETYTEKEKELRSRYAHDILPGSYRVAGAPDREGWGKKHTVLVKCCYEGCTNPEPRCLATSDLQFDTTKYCVEHSKIIKANRRRTQLAKKKLT